MRWFTFTAGAADSENVGQVPPPPPPPQQPRVTHCNQAALVLPVGAVRPQDGDHHGDKSRQVQHNEASGPLGHLGAGE